MDQALTSFYLFLNWEPYTWFALFVLLNVLDGLTTVKALSLGGREINPVMRLAMQMFGTVPALVLLKLAMLYGVFANLGTVILYLPAMVGAYVAVVVWNLSVIRKKESR